MSNENILLKMINAQANFAFDILREKDIQNSSTIFSSVSISTVLAMVYLGAKENTAEQIRRVIGKDATEEEIHTYFSSFLAYVNSLKLDGIILDVANRIYLKRNFKILNSYIEGIKRYYCGEIVLIDFCPSSWAAGQINAFVKKYTRNLIKDIVGPDSFDSLTAIVLINAIYFKGKWEKPFEKWATRDEIFYATLDSNKKVKMMSLEETNLNYYEDDDCQIVGLPYKGHEFIMYLLLPSQRCNLQNLINTINTSKLIEILSKIDKTLVKVKIPRFEIESTIDVTKILKNLGITEAFTDYANFKGISVDVDILKITGVIHKALIKTDEEGSIAAAATAVTMTFGCALSRPYKTFIANHPFLFIIADKKLNFFFVGTHF